jgi:two-component system NtrC family sensor kinase
MTAGLPGTVAERGLAIVGAVASQLNAGLPAVDALRSVAATMCRELGVRGVALWVHEPNATTFRRVASGDGPSAPDRAERLDLVPPAGPDAWRGTLLHDRDVVGLLEVLGASAAMAPLLTVLGDVLAPFLAATELSEDLAYEVAAQSREIDEQRRFTSLVIDSLPVGLYVVDRDYRILVWNRKRETGTQGVPRQEAVGRRLFDVLTRQNAAELQAEFDAVFRSGQLQQDELEVARGGETRIYRITRIPMRLGGEAVTHVITIGEDVTEWRAIQVQIMQSEKLAAVGQLAAGVMHEINNPLATIGACVAAIEGRLAECTGPGAVAIQEYAEIVDKEVHRCTSIVDGLLDFSRPKGTRKAPVSVTAVVEDALFLFRHHDRYKHYVTGTELAPDLPLVQGNQEQLIQVMMALLLNALDAMEPGGRLTVRTLRSRWREHEVLIEVEDTGRGIPSQLQSRIFEPFFTTKAQGRGTGLGLSICYGIVEEHRGRIEVDSHPGRGSVFRVSLPVAP